MFTSISFNSCSNDDDHNSVNEPIDKDVYYVKYTIKGNGAYGRFSNWSVTTPNGGYSNNGYQTTSWTQTYGPTKKGFNCNVNIKNYIYQKPTIEIHVSKNNEPFALKEIKNGTSASYTIK